MRRPKLDLAVGFATCGRADILLEAVLQLNNQTRPPDRVIICYTKLEDVAGLDGFALGHGHVTMVQSAPGLPLQRNVIMDRVQDCDVVLFLDDDFLVAPGYLAHIEAALSAHPDIVAATGTPIADDIKGPGLSVAAGRALIAADGPAPDGFDPAPHAYGCNMAINIAAAREHDIRFDERLPLYAWSEDMDFTHRLGRFGRVVKLRGARGVHLGVKRGRSSGRRLGYSQVANPIYLRNKGSYSWRRALGSVGRNLAANGLRAFWSEPYIDRRGRLLGNGLAFLDLLRGRLQPERVLEL